MYGCCRGGPVPLLEYRGRVSPFGKLCSAHWKNKVTRLSLKFQVRLCIKLMQNTLVLIILILYRLCRSYFRSWVFSLISINDTGLLLHIKLAATYLFKIWLPNQQPWISFHLWKIRLWRSIRLLFYQILLIRFSPQILGLEYARRLLLLGKSWY